MAKHRFYCEALIEIDSDLATPAEVAARAMEDEWNVRHATAVVVSGSHHHPFVQVIALDFAKLVPEDDDAPDPAE